MDFNLDCQVLPHDQLLIGDALPSDQERLLLLDVLNILDIVLAKSCRDAGSQQQRRQEDAGFPRHAAVQLYNPSELSQPL